MTDTEIVRRVKRRLTAQLKEATQLEKAAWTAYIVSNRYFGPAEKEWQRTAAVVVKLEAAIANARGK
jgi:hypothetical protein